MKGDGSDLGSAGEAGLGGSGLGSSGLGALGSIVTARGTADGLILRVDGRASQDTVLAGVRSFMQSRRSFVEGNEVILEWVGEAPQDNVVSAVRANLVREFGVVLRDTPAQVVFDAPVELSESVERYAPMSSDPSRRPSLFDGLEVAGMQSAPTGTGSNVGRVGAAMSWDEPDCRMVYGTLRSGQKVETEHSVVIFGDVNSGAEIIAGGDVVVLGCLRGVAHAGAYDETGGGRTIFALHLEPTQLRIGAVISRGVGGGSVPEIARVDGASIVVEPYQPKSAPNGRRLAA